MLRYKYDYIMNLQGIAGFAQLPQKIQVVSINV
jgi:hypothetical protein